jgi:cytochrome c-type biogenesis protein CcmE
MKRRHKRIGIILIGLVGLGIATYLVASAFRENLVFFFSPTQVAAKEAPVDRTFRIGGLVQDGTLKRDADGLTVRFTVTDTAASIPVVYKGILPDLFKEGRGCVAQGKIGSEGVFQADQVLAKHDANYMPPEAGAAIDKAKHAREAAKTVVPN